VTTIQKKVIRLVNFDLDESNLVLDVGCGLRPSGDVNVDVYINKVSPDLGVIIEGSKIANPVKSSAYCLPFKDGVFDVVRSRALLEHLDKPTSALKEMLRVARRKVVFEVPHRFFRHSWGWKSQSERHKQVFSVKSVDDWIRRLGYYAVIDTEFHFVPSIMPIIRLPWMIKVTIMKGKF